MYKRQRYSGAAGTEFAHEAGFDAFMTGAAYAGLLCLTQAAEALPAPLEASTSTVGAGDGTSAVPALKPQPARVWYPTCHANISACFRVSVDASFASCASCAFRVSVDASCALLDCALGISPVTSYSGVKVHLCI